MNKYRVQATISVEVAVEIKATSLEHALQQARELEQDDPVCAGLVSIPKRTEYIYYNETKISGVTDA